MFVRNCLAGIALGAVAVVASSASASELGIVGDAQFGSSFVDFGQFPDGAPYAPAPGSGTFEVSQVNAGVFSSAGVTTGELGQIQSLSATVTPVPPFMVFDTGGNNLQLVFTSAPPGNSGFYDISSTPNGAVASFNVDGVINDNGKTVDDFTATFSATFDGITAAALPASFPQNAPFSATIDATPVPEPASLATLALLGVPLLRRRRAAAPRF